MIERLFVDTIPAQHKGLEQVLRDFAAEIIIGDDMFFGVLPKLLGPRSKRPPIVLCATSILHWRREDGAPHFLGLPPATTQAQLRQYSAISQEHDRVVNQPLARRLNPLLKDFGVGLRPRRRSPHRSSAIEPAIGEASYCRRRRP